MSCNLRNFFLFLFLLFFYLKPALAEVTFQEILENPSDIEINLKYAKEQEALGRYKATITTLGVMISCVIFRFLGLGSFATITTAK